MSTYEEQIILIDGFDTAKEFFLNNRLKDLSDHEIRLLGLKLRGLNSQENFLELKELVSHVGEEESSRRQDPNG